MKRLFRGAACVVTLCLTAACATSAKIERMTVGETRRTTIKHGEVVTMPVVADLTISPTKRSFSKVFPGSAYSYSNGKSVTLLGLANKYKADVIVEPRYTVVYEPNNTVRITVDGFPAKYKSFRSLEMNDLKMLDRAASLGKADVSRVTAATTQIKPIARKGQSSTLFYAHSSLGFQSTSFVDLAIQKQTNTGCGVGAFGEISSHPSYGTSAGLEASFSRSIKKSVSAMGRLRLGFAEFDPDNIFLGFAIDTYMFKLKSVRVGLTAEYRIYTGYTYNVYDVDSNYYDPNTALLGLAIQL